jgi:hypothetical protein
LMSSDNAVASAGSPQASHFIGGTGIGMRYSLTQHVKP